MNKVVLNTGRFIISLLVLILLLGGLWMAFTQDSHAANLERLEALRLQREHFQQETAKIKTERALEEMTLVSKINNIKLNLPAKFCLEDPEDCPSDFQLR